MTAAQDVKLAHKHEPAYRCAFCHERVEPEFQAPCAGCGALLHAECRVQHGGCPTLGCAHAGPGARQAAPEQAVRPPGDAAGAGPLLAATMAGGSLLAGAAGMVLSFLALSTQVQALVAAGAAGFVAGALLVATGVLALAVLAGRREGARPSPLSGVSPRAAAALAARGSLLAGAGGMLLSFLTLLSPHLNELIAGGAGFVAGAILVLGGVVALALEVARREETPRPPS